MKAIKIIQELNDEQLNEVAGGAGQAHRNTHTIVRGDSLGKIVHRFGYSVDGHKPYLQLIRFH